MIARLLSWLHADDTPIAFDSRRMRLVEQATADYLGQWRLVAPPIIRRERKPSHAEIIQDRERRAAAMRQPIPFRRRA